MRSNVYLRTLDEIKKHEEKRKEQIKNLEQKIKEYLESGGKITVIPEGVSSFPNKQSGED